MTEKSAKNQQEEEADDSCAEHENPDHGKEYPIEDFIRRKRLQNKVLESIIEKMKNEPHFPRTSEPLK
jgi:hypothetical protein